MIHIEEALKLVAAQPCAPQAEARPLKDSLGYCLAEDIRAPFDLPAFDNSAMDGYALGGLSDIYTLVGEVAAGDTTPKSLAPGEAMRIFTGGKIPANTSAVMMQEKTSVSGTTLRLEMVPQQGQFIRPKGGELAKGQQVFDAGHCITPASAGLIGSLGLATVKVYRKPHIRLITTGNELVEPGQPLQEGQIYESNSLAISAALQKFGFACAATQQIEDDYERIKTGIKDYLQATDVLLLSGGISVGDYDYVKEALEENGVEKVFYKVFQKPGKPLYFGRKGEKYVFALPGNPASSLTCFYVYVLPLLQKMSGATQQGLLQTSVPLAHDYELKGDRPAFLKAHIEGPQVSILDGQGSSMIHSLAMANALAFIPRPGSLQKGTPVTCILI